MDDMTLIIVADAGQLCPARTNDVLLRYKMKDGEERWSRTPVSLDGGPPHLSATIGESGRSSAYACKLAAAQVRWEHAADIDA
jgi:hypothetical protein